MSSKEYGAISGSGELADDSRLTAYALGELEGEELAEVEALVASDPQARALVDEVRDTAKLLGERLSTEAAPGLTDAQRTAIEARSSSPRQRGHLLSMRTKLSIAFLATAAAALLAANVWMRSEQAAPASGAPFAYDLDGSGARVARAVEEPVLRDSEARAFTGLEGLGYVGGDAPTESAMPGLVGAPSARPTAPGAGGPSSPGPPGRGRVGKVAGGERTALSDLGYTDELLEAGVEHDTEGYDHTPENDFRLVRDAALSTFSIDVDTASYANVRRFLSTGQLPPADAVRIEELVNYFPYDYAGPRGATPFAVHTEVGGCPWAPRHRLVRIGLKGREIGVEGRKPSNLVFLLDVSGSMNNADKLPLLKRAMQMLVQELGEQDRVAIVVYAGAAGLVLPSTPATEKWQILEAIERLDAGGSTAGGAGIQLAYEVAQRNFIEGGMNRVLLATDGDFNVGVSDDGSLVRMVEEKRGSGVFLSVLGFGTGNVKDSKMEKLADNGNGSYAYIDSVLEARKVLVEELGATLETIAKDVKIQVEFNPLEVEAYRLIGYENRLLAAQDFNDDKKDAGEIGAGHTVTALYEIVPAGQGVEVPGVDPLRYQSQGEPSGAAFSGELMNLKLRYKQPDGDESTLIEFPVKDGGGSFFETSDDLRFAGAVAAFGMLLRDSKYAGNARYESVLNWATESLGDDVGGYREQFLAMVRRAGELAGR